MPIRCIPRIPRIPRNPRNLPVALAFCCILLFGAALANGDDFIDRPAKPTPILPFDQVRVGMKGYGLTVFHGVAIEPFACEVVSVMRDFAPKKGVVWIRCPDARMQLTGPVEGMSGSPIFLWSEGEPQELGKGGKLIGAFAFGYSLSKDCYVGIQPIENMRDTGGRADMKDAGDAENGGAASMTAALDTLANEPAVRGLPPAATWRADLFRKLLATANGRNSKQVKGDDRSIPAPASFAGHATPAMLSMKVCTPGLASVLAPLLEPAGIAPMESPLGSIAGLPPPGIDANTIRMRPGSVLAIPLAWGDMDLSAQGTVTDVTPDGRVLAFGHAMFGQGPAAVPMASGYVHLIMPGLQNSFKLGGSGAIHGAIVRDEKTAVVGIPQARFASSPVSVQIQMPGQKPTVYHYHVVHHQTYTPMLTTVVAIESMGANQDAPMQSTARLQGSVVFAGGRKLNLDTLIPNPESAALAMQLFPPLIAMAQNPYEIMTVESADLSITVEPVLRVGSLSSARLDRNEVSPGEKLGLAIKIQPYGKPMFEKRTELAIPEGLADGEYQLHVCDAMTYAGLYMNSRPHLMNTASADDLFAVVKWAEAIPSDAVFVVLLLQEQGLAVGRQELSQLPSSRKAMIGTPTSTLATPFTESVDKVVPVGLVPQGDLLFVLSVRKDRRKE